MDVLERIDEKLGRLVNHMVEPHRVERVVVGTEGGKVAWIRIVDAIDLIESSEFIINSGGKVSVSGVFNELKEILKGERGDV